MKHLSLPIHKTDKSKLSGLTRGLFGSFFAIALLQKKMDKTLKIRQLFCFSIVNKKKKFVFSQTL